MTPTHHTDHTTGAAQAGEGPTKVTEFAASGLIFKDSVEVVSLPDPDGTAIPLVVIAWSCTLSTVHNFSSTISHLNPTTTNPPPQPPTTIPLPQPPTTVENVLIFISEFKRSLTDKLAKDFFSEPSQASVTCAAIGPVTIKNPNVKASGGQEVFAEGKGLNLFQQKTLRVRRVYDEKHDTLLYVSYSTRLANNNDEGVSSGRYRTSICALPVAPTVVAAAVPAPVPAEVAP